MNDTTTWLLNPHARRPTAHQAYLHRSPGGETVLFTYCGRPLPAPQQAPDTTPRCKSCLRASL